jgi:hypothetical protein
VRKLGPPSRGPPIVVVQDATEPFSALNRSIHSGAVGQLLDQLVVEPLVIALQVVVLLVLLDGLAKVALAQWDDLGQTLGFDGQNKPFCVCIQIWAPRRQLDRLHAGRLENLPGE